MKPMDNSSDRRPSWAHWKLELVADLDRVVARDRWGQAFLVIGWIHLSIFTTCQLLYSSGDRAALHFLPLWALEFAANLWVLRRFGGRGWHRNSALTGILVRVWATFLILSFNTASLNNLTGFTLDWFKLGWTTLSTFGFATTAYLVSLWFFVPAVFMYFAGLVMVVNPGWEYLTYGVSWWVLFESIGFFLERRRIRGLSDPNLSSSTEPVTKEEILA